jgi:hypothetical protein
MNIVVRIAALMLLLTVAGFCIFGFLATFEPVDRSTQVLWRIIYGAVILACLAQALWLVRRKKKPA